MDNAAVGGELRGGEVEGSNADGVQRCGGLAAEAVGVTGKGFFGTARGKTGGDDDDAAHPLGVTDFFTQGKDGAHDAAVVKLYHVEVEHSLFARQINAAGGKSFHGYRGEAVRTLRFFTSGASASSSAGFDAGATEALPLWLRVRLMPFISTLPSEARSES